MSSCIATINALNSGTSSTSGAELPTCPCTCANTDAPSLFLDLPRSTISKTESGEFTSCGVTVLRISVTAVKAVTTNDNGAVMVWSTPSSLHRDCIDRESLPTGIERPSGLQKSRATVLTVSYNAASSTLAAAIQFAESLTSLISATATPARLVSASATAIRPDASGEINARGGRSPIAMASPLKPSKSDSVTAQSATGI